MPNSLAKEMLNFIDKARNGKDIDREYAMQVSLNIMLIDEIDAEDKVLIAINLLKEWTGDEQSATALLNQFIEEVDARRKEPLARES